MVGVALIAAFACPGPPAVLVERRPGVVRTTAVACDGDRRVVVRRARLRRRPLGGRRITAVSQAGRRVAWAERQHGGARLRAWVHVARIARGRAERVHRRLVLRRNPYRHMLPPLDVVLTSRGELAWLAGWHVRVASIRGRARVVARDGEHGLGLEDDRTLRWWAYEDAPRTYEDETRLRFLDLRPWPRGRCPDRRRFRLVAESADLVVTRAHYDSTFLDTYVDVFRACARGTRSDPVVLESSGDSRGGDVAEVIGISDPWIAFRRELHSRAGCEWLTVEAVNGLTGAAGQSATFTECESTDTAVVTERGIPAWITSTTERSAVHAAGQDGVIELDSAGRDGLSDLTFEGTVVRWLHDGEPRAADLG